jgi:hypothetical protein
MKSNRMDYIGDKSVNARAAKYYGVQVSDVAKYVGQHASRTKQARRTR